MDEKLIKEINRFYKEMDREESTDLGELACILLPKLVSKIRQLEKQLNEK